MTTERYEPGVKYYENGEWRAATEEELARTRRPKTKQLSEPQINVLVNLLEGRDAGDGLRGRSEHGGHDKVIRALLDRGLIEIQNPWPGSKLTEAGTEVAKLYLRISDSASALVREAFRSDGLPDLERIERIKGVLAENREELRDRWGFR